jgi:hypothetical protein
METAHETWSRCLVDYAWAVDLRTFKHRAEYPGHFGRTIGSGDVKSLEDLFRIAVDKGGPYQVAGEVCYWKNYGNHLSRDRMTLELLVHLAAKSAWDELRKAVTDCCAHPSLAAFLRLRAAAGETHGFATPVTFVSFYDPASYPMVDKHIADWWVVNKASFCLAQATAFSQRRADGWVQTTSQRTTEQNWNAYLAWAGFCRDYGKRLGGWRARDVEMAVWMAQKGGETLPVVLAGGGH